jgi:hypothetical protein
MNRKKKKSIGTAEPVHFLVRGELLAKLPSFKCAQFKMLLAGGEVFHLLLLCL